MRFELLAIRHVERLRGDVVDRGAGGKRIVLRRDVDVDRPERREPDAGLLVLLRRLCVGQLCVLVVVHRERHESWLCRRAGARRHLRARGNGEGEGRVGVRIVGADGAKCVSGSGIARGESERILLDDGLCDDGLRSDRARLVGCICERFMRGAEIHAGADGGCGHRRAAKADRDAGCDLAQTKLAIRNGSARFPPTQTRTVCTCHECSAPPPMNYAIEHACREVYAGVNAARP